MIKYIIYFSFVFLFFSCEGKFINEPYHQDLPIYSEEGLDVSGAFINDIPWNAIKRTNLFANNNASVSYTVSQDSMVFTLPLDEETATEISFTLKDLRFNQFEDFLQLDGQRIIFGNRSFGTVITNSNNFTNLSECSNMENGQIIFQSVKLKDENQIIFSGTFGFDYCINNNQFYKVRFGRFDFKFNIGTNFNIMN